MRVEAREANGCFLNPYLKAFEGKYNEAVGFVTKHTFRRVGDLQTKAEDHILVKIGKIFVSFLSIITVFPIVGLFSAAYLCGRVQAADLPVNRVARKPPEPVFEEDIPEFPDGELGDFDVYREPEEPEIIDLVDVGFHLPRAPENELPIVAEVGANLAPQNPALLRQRPLQVVPAAPVAPKKEVGAMAPLLNVQEQQELQIRRDIEILFNKLAQLEEVDPAFVYQMAALLEFLKDPCPEVRRLATKDLRFFTSSSSLNIVIIQKTEALSFLVPLLHDPDWEIRRNAAAILADLAIDYTENQTAIGQTDAIDVLTGLLFSTDENDWENLAEIIQALASFTKNHRKNEAKLLATPGILGKLREFIDDDDLRENGLEVLLNLVKYDPVIEKLVEDNIIPRCIELLKDPDLTEGEKDNVILLLNRMALNGDVVFAEAQTAVGENGGIEILADHFISPKYRPFRLSALNALSALVKHHRDNTKRLLAVDDVIPKLRQLLHDGEHTPDVLWLLSNLVEAHSDFKATLIEAGTVRVCVDLLERRGFPGKHHLIDFLAQLELDGNKPKIDLQKEFEEIIPLLVKFLVHKKPEVKLSAIRALGILAMDHLVNQEFIRENLAFEPLKQLLLDPDTRMRSAAASTLAHLANDNPDNQAEIGKQNIIPVLVKLLSDNEEKVRNQAIFALYKWAEREAENQKAVRQAIITSKIELDRDKFSPDVAEAVQFVLQWIHGLD